MRLFLRYIPAEFRKTKCLKIRLAHVWIPIGAAAAFLAYSAYSPSQAETKTAAYFQVLGMGFPFLTGLFCELLSEQEEMAGGFHEMLALPGKVSSFYAKLFLLWIFGVFAVFIASVLFGAGSVYLLRWRVVGISFYMESALVLSLCSLPSYIWHLFLAFRFPKGVSVGLGIVESLTAALMCTGMGDGIWIYIPCGWIPRLTTMLLTARSRQLAYETAFSRAALYCICLSGILAVIFGVWAEKWEGSGRKP